MLGFVRSYRRLYKTRLNLNPVLAMPPSSVLLQIDESGKFQKLKKSSGSKAAPLGSDSLLNQVNTVGMIGGASADSTSNFLRKFLQLSVEETDLPFLLCSDPLLNKELLSHERSSFPALNGKNGGVQLDDTVIVENLQRNGFFLRKQGLSKTVKSRGFEVVLPDKATMEHTLIPAFDALSRKDMEGARNLLRIALQVLLVRAVNAVILASNDMLDLLPPYDPLLKKCIDPVDALARSTIKWVKSAKKAVHIWKLEIWRGEKKATSSSSHLSNLLR